MIEISHLVKKYGSHYAVKDLDICIADGQIYGFLGPNGAGKSTTMNIITGYLAPTSGEVKIDGFDIVKEPEEAKKRIGYLPEIPPLYQEMTVEEYLKFAAQLKKVPRAERAEAVEKAIDTAKLEDVRNRMIANLSKGYRQRVGLAQAVLGDPKIIILDEPTVGLDPKQMIEMRELIRSLKENHTVILSSHILSEVSAICDQILIISKGELVASDTPQGLQEKMQGAGCLEMSVQGSAGKLEEILKGMDQIESFQIRRQEGALSVVIWEKAKADVREPLFYKLAEKKMPILSLNKKVGSLEDIFLQLTENEGAREAEEETAREPEAAKQEENDPVPEAADQEKSAAGPESAAEEQQGEGVNDDSNL